jgi:signal transduction histidine kinase
LCLVGSFMDITEEKALQDQLIRSERLAATGQLAASIAHEINSPLQGIITTINVIEKGYGNDENLSEHLALLNDGFTGIRDTVKKLLDLNRPGKETKQNTNVNRVIEDTVSLLKSHLKKNKVEIILSLSPEVPDMAASPQRLGQVFLNLINNSVEAMVHDVKSGDSPKVREKTGGEISIYSSVSKDTIVIRVTDTGPGISKGDLENVFDPFYSRKKKMGMGMGLSVCNNIIEEHGGSITVENSPEGGAAFTISLLVKRTKK